MSAKSIAITGASGFLGQHLCEAFLRRGYRVRAVYRRTDPPPALLRLGGDGAELMNADLTLPGMAARVCEGMDIILHSAALAYDWGSLEIFKRANVDATAGLVEAAQREGCRDFIFISSAVVHGFGPHIDTTEEGPYHVLRYPYPLTKLMAERIVLAHNRPGFRTVSVRPCNVYGPGDLTSTYEMYKTILEGRFGYIGNGAAYTCPIYIDDLCAGVVMTVESTALGGEAVILTDGQKVPWRDYTLTMFKAVGSKKRPLSIPVPLAFAAAGFMGGVATLARSSVAPLLTRYRVEQVASHYHFSNQKAYRILGFKPTVYYQEGLHRTAETFLRMRRDGF
jgi:nucleoside-diphosphate-sugar epimerase